MEEKKIKDLLDLTMKKYLSKNYKYNKETLQKFENFINKPENKSFDFKFYEDNLEIELYKDKEEGLYTIENFENFQL